MFGWVKEADTKPISHLFSNVANKVSVSVWITSDPSSSANVPSPNDRTKRVVSVSSGRRNSVECTVQPWVECMLQPWVENMIAAHGRKWRMQPTVEYTLPPSIESIKCSPRSNMDSAAHGGKRALQPSVENAMCSLRSKMSFAAYGRIVVCSLLHPPPPPSPPSPSSPSLMSH